MAGDFYDRQINKVEVNDKLREYNGLINDYLKATSIEDSKIIKDLIIKKATSELSFKELMALKDTLSERGQNEVGKNKIKLYELTAGLYNNTNLTSSNNKSENYYPQGQQDLYNESLPPFEIAGGRITKKVLGLDGLKEKTYDIVGGDSEYLGNGKYRIYLESSRKVGKYGRSSSSDSIVIGYRGGNTIQIYDSEGERRLGIVKIQNNAEMYESGHIGNGRYNRRIEQRNSFISFELKEYGTKIELDLSLSGR